jgi:uncharacterized protein
MTDVPLGKRIADLPWRELDASLNDNGRALTPQLLSHNECDEMTALYDDSKLFRSTIDMARYRFGAGQYRYFANPVPKVVQELRRHFWPYLLPIAREWATKLGQPSPWPDDLDDWIALCHQAGQTRPTALMLRYETGDWNALHRDLYGECVFPLQVVIGLDRPGIDYQGGEFVVVEQRPRAQSRATTTVIPKGHAVIFTTRDRPLQSVRGWTTAPMRHGVSTVASGQRHALGVLFHDAT